MDNNIFSRIECSLLAPDSTISTLEDLCNEAILKGYIAVSVPPLFVKKAKEFLAGTSIKLSTVIGYPFGYSVVEAKLSETVMAIIDGADELGLVINVLALKNRDWQWLAHELNSIMPVVRSKAKVLKIIIETRLLTKDEIIKCCDLYGIAGVDFIETATGYGAAGTSLEAVSLIRNYLAESVKIKVSGTINSYEHAVQLLAAGADRLGCDHQDALLAAK